MDEAAATVVPLRAQRMSAAVPFSREPPRSIEAEHSVLGAILLGGASTFAEVADTLQARDFFDRAHGLIWRAMEVASKAGDGIDIVTVWQQVVAQAVPNNGGVSLPYLNQLEQGVASARNIRSHAEIVREHSAARDAIGLFDSLTARAFAGGCDVPALLDEAHSQLAQLAQRTRNPSRRVPLLSLAQLEEQAQQVAWLVKRVIPADSMGMIFGASGTFKSFIALDMALHVAHGLPWLGRKTKKGPVIYIAAEGGAGLWARIKAWHRSRGLNPAKAALFVVPMGVDLTADAWRVVEAAQSVGTHPLLVVVDTLSQTYSGEENSANEMAAYFRELGLRFRALWACAVVILHHSGHNATERPRGSSAIRANLDFLMGVWRDEKEMLATLACLKQKDAELFDDETFVLARHEVGQDEDGDALASLVARHLSSAEEVEQAMQAEVKAGRGGKNQLLLSLASAGMREKELRKAFYEDCGLDEAEAKRKAYQRARAWAIKAGFLDFAEGVVITLKRA